MAGVTSVSVRSGVCCRKGSAPVAAVERHGRGHLRFGPVGCVLPEGFSPSCRRRSSWPGSPPFGPGGCGCRGGGSAPLAAVEVHGRGHLGSVRAGGGCGWGSAPVAAGEGSGGVSCGGCRRGRV